jgi:hypothetical protein
LLQSFYSAVECVDHLSDPVAVHRNRMHRVHYVYDDFFQVPGDSIAPEFRKEAENLLNARPELRLDFLRFKHRVDDPWPEEERQMQDAHDGPCYFHVVGDENDGALRLVDDYGILDLAAEERSHKKGDDSHPDMLRFPHQILLKG